jgi:hypothetical protein
LKPAQAGLVLINQCKNKYLPFGSFNELLQVGRALVTSFQFRRDEVELVFGIAKCPSRFCLSLEPNIRHPKLGDNFYSFVEGRR